jgi:riboflavin biosynthesis pyrimidine reductase
MDTAVKVISAAAKSVLSGTGTITADNKKYNVKFNADGTGEICDEANKCESFF